MENAKPTKGGGDGVRLNVYLPKRAYESLKKLQEMTGKASFAETIRDALQLYLALQEEIDDNLEIVVKDKKGKESKTLKLVF